VNTHFPPPLPLYFPSLWLHNFNNMRVLSTTPPLSTPLFYSAHENEIRHKNIKLQTLILHTHTKKERKKSCRAKAKENRDTKLKQKLKQRIGQGPRTQHNGATSVCRVAVFCSVPFSVLCSTRDAKATARY